MLKFRGKKKGEKKKRKERKKEKAKQREPVQDFLVHGAVEFSSCLICTPTGRGLLLPWLYLV